MHSTTLFTGNVRHLAHGTLGLPMRRLRSRTRRGRGGSTRGRSSSSSSLSFTDVANSSVSTSLTRGTGSGTSSGRVGRSRKGGATGRSRRGRSAPASGPRSAIRRGSRLWVFGYGRALVWGAVVLPILCFILCKKVVSRGPLSL